MMRRVLCAVVIAGAALTGGCVDFRLQEVIGVWGARHVELQADIEGAVLRLDCGEGEIRQPLIFDDSLRFSVEGNLTERSRDPFAGGSRTWRARYDGRLVSGGRLEIVITPLDSVATVSRYELQRDRPGQLFPCK